MNERSRVLTREASRLIALSARLLSRLDEISDDDGSRADRTIALANAYTQLAVAAATVAFVEDEAEPEREEITREETLVRQARDEVHRMAAEVTARVYAGEEPEAAFRNVVQARNERVPS